MVHRVPDEGIDDGPVLATLDVPILATDTLDTLTARVHTAEHALLVDVLVLARTGRDPMTTPTTTPCSTASRPSRSTTW